MARTDIPPLSGIEKLRHTAAQLAALKDQSGLNADERTRVVERVEDIASRITLADTREDEAGLAGLNEAASSLLAYLKGIRDACAARAGGDARSDAVSKELLSYEGMVEEAYEAYEVDKLAMRMQRTMHVDGPPIPDTAPPSYSLLSAPTDMSSTSPISRLRLPPPIPARPSTRPIPPGTYVIMNAHTHTVMDMFGFGLADGTGIVGHASNGGANQRWSFRASQGGMFVIHNIATNKFLSDIQTLASITGLATVQSHNRPEGWTLEKGGYVPHAFFFSTKAYPGRVLDIYCGRSQNGTAIVLQTRNPPPQTRNQLWHLVVTPLATPTHQFLVSRDSLAIPAGTFAFVNACTHTVLDMWESGVEDGTWIVGHRSNEGRNQQWVVSGSASEGYTVQSAATGNYISTRQTRSGIDGFATAQSSRVPDGWTFRSGNRFAPHAFFISPRSRPDRVLDLMHASPSDGTAIILQTENPPAQTLNQMWYLVVC